jgi:hypothetical protein
MKSHDSSAPKSLIIPPITAIDIEKLAKKAVGSVALFTP